MKETYQEFNKIYEDTYDNVFKLVILKCDDFSYIQDLIQDIYEEIYTIMKKKGNNYIKSKEFIYELARQKIYKYYNSKSKKNISLLNDYNIEKDENTEYDSFSDNLIIEEIEDDLLNNLTIDEIWNEIKKEELINQKILVLYFLQELTIKEIAETLNINVNTVKTRLYRTTAKLKNDFQNKVKKEENINE